MGEEVTGETHNEAIKIHWLVGETRGRLHLKRYFTLVFNAFMISCDLN